MAPFMPSPALQTLTLALAKAAAATPPKAVQAACRRGLDLAADYGGEGLTDGAKARARAMASGEAQTDAQLARMANFFGRHAQNRADPGAAEPTPGAVAWLIWGGDAGKRWADSRADGAAKAKLVGGNKGAWKTAQDAAQGKANPEAYARRVYSNITHKSAQEGPMHPNNKTDALGILQAALRKAGTGPGSRGGKVIGTTRSGKPIYEANAATSAHMEPFSRHPHDAISGPPDTHKQIHDFMHERHKDYTADDHHDASHAHFYGQEGDNEHSWDQGMAHQVTAGYMRGEREEPANAAPPKRAKH